jgi:hypothetical protein
MKFITVSTFKDAYYTLPEAEKNKIMKASAQDIFNLKTKLGDKYRFFSTAGSATHYSISEFDTYEEYIQSLNTVAFNAGLVSFVSIPVVEMDDKVMKQYKDFIDNLERPK